ncbi:hypothetical protein COU59_00020 [Candidatus Pacearchaeota archaeon CG10_big_fil_rev_8_21_14_0_10_34_12]|nr:MAG: hypothetical protein COU59_00020 [Candidatus Pacearchaeota archaeon CG10_big_fil_rev_8_21_14_0_10_34_12]
MHESYRKRVIEYLKKNLEKGYTEDSLKWALVKQGYSRTEVSRAIVKAREELSRKKMERDDGRERPVIKHELYDSENKPIKIETRKPSSFSNFFKDLFS